MYEPDWRIKNYYKVLLERPQYHTTTIGQQNVLYRNDDVTLRVYSLQLHNKA